MSRTSIIFEYLRDCPKLADLWSIGGQESMGDSVIIPNGASSRFQYDERFDVHGNYSADIIPQPSVFEDYQINCYRFFDSKDSTAPKSNINVLAYDDVVSICEWIEDQDKAGNFPEIGEDVVSIECNPYVPQVRYVDNELGIIAYFITVRIRYVNPAERRSVYYEHPHHTERTENQGQVE